MLDVAQLEREITDAFADRGVADAVLLGTRGEWFDEKGERREYADPEVGAAHRFFLGKRWSEVAGAPLLSWPQASSSLIFLEPEVAAAYLPAYMLTTLRSPDEGVTILEGIVASLARPAEALADRGSGATALRTGKEAQGAAMRASELARFDRLLDALSERQKQSIAHFLEHAAEVLELDGLENRARLALDLFWGRFLARE
jgi:hypothetical protein